MRKTISILLAALAATCQLGMAQPTAAPPEPGTAPDFPALGREIVGLVREHFLDRGRAARWADSYAEYAEDIQDAGSFRDATRRALAELATSHTQYYRPDDPGYHDLLAIFEQMLAPTPAPPAPRDASGRPEAAHEDASRGAGGAGERRPHVESLGLHAVPGDDGWFVARILPGGAAEQAGLRRGDLLLRVDGEPFHPVRSLQGTAGRPLALEVRSAPGEAPRVVRATPRLVHPKEEWLAAQRTGTRLLDHQGRRIAYALVWSCAGEEHQELIAEALGGDLADAEALVLDLRDGWGGCNPGFLDLFNPATPELVRIDREGARHRWAPSWRRPLVVLVNAGTRSGKEVVARAIQRHRLGTLVGERTAGAVVAGRPFLLADGSLLYLAVEDVRVDGERLESQGVTPDVVVPAPVPFAQGRDPQLERALKIAVELAAQASPSRSDSPPS